jgi:hypothetical protein
MLTVRKYESQDKNKWDDFITHSKNGYFLFNRDYMEYHSDRFYDFSLMFFKGNKLMAVMPANIEDDKVISHGGLTFGGIISGKKMETPGMLKIFQKLKEYLRLQGVKELIYKPIPHIYHTMPAEEDLYALFINKAKLFRRDVSSTIYMEEKLSYSRNMKRKIRKGKEIGFKIRESQDYEKFMEIEKKRLDEKYGVKPTHTGKEIKLLASKFPNNIKLFTAEKDGEIYGGVIVFEGKYIAHGQYQSSTDEGLDLNCNDLILDYLISDYYKDKKYIDFGISNEKNGLYLNKGLIHYKSQFGAQAVVHDFYKLEI